MIGYSSQFDAVGEQSLLAIISSTRRAKAETEIGSLSPHSISTNARTRNKFRCLSRRAKGFGAGRLVGILSTLRVKETNAIRAS